MNWLSNRHNLIVYPNSDSVVFRRDAGSDYFPANRLFEYTSEDLRIYYKDNIQFLADMPTLFVTETHGQRMNPARLSRIDSVQIISGEVRFEFSHLYDLLSSEEIFDRRYFKFADFERSRTHWAVKEGVLLENLFDLLRERDQLSPPKFFNVVPWPMPNLGHIAVMMPFKNEFNPIYETIKATCASLNLKTLRVDEIYGPTKIVDDIFAAIVQSRLVISDLTGRNPNVLYETGLAHAQGHDVIAIVQNGNDVPFDLKQFRYVPYLPNEEGLTKLQRDLRESILSVIESV